jgi:hypothetical protein
MGFRMLLVIGLATAAILPAAHGQIVLTYPGLPRYEVGVQFTGIQLTGPITAGDLGVGAHFGYNFQRYVSFEANANAFRIGADTTHNFHTGAAFFGPRIGYTSREAGI